MSNERNKVQDIFIGIVVLITPLIALGYTFGLLMALLFLCGVIGSVLIAKLALFLFAKNGRLAKGAAILVWPELLLNMFLPKYYKLKIAEMKEKENLSFNSSVNTGATRPLP